MPQRPMVMPKLYPRSIRTAPLYLLAGLALLSAAACGDADAAADADDCSSERIETGGGDSGNENSGETGGEAGTHIEDVDDATVELLEAKARWQEQKPDCYRMNVRVSCFCLGETIKPRTVTVEDDTVTDVEPAIPEEDTGPVDTYTVPMLFTEVEEALNTADVVTAEYDDEYGFPTRVSIDPDQIMTDDQIRYSVNNFEPLD